MPVRIHILGLVSSLALAGYDARAQAATGDNEIIVTAQLREQRPIDIPFALTAISGRQMDELGIKQFDALSRFVPGFIVLVQSPNNPGFVMRGLTSDAGTAYNEPRVSVFQDGVSISKSRGSYVELFDLARVEVAKGPQSTLYGRGALIGAVNIVQNKADPRAFEASASASYGNYNAYIVEAMVNAPLADGVAARISGRIRERDGHIANLLGGEDFNSTDTKAVRASLHADRAGLSFDLIGNYQKDRPTGTAFKSILYRPTDPATGAVIGDLGRNSGAALAPGANFQGGRALGLDREVWGVTGLATWTLNDQFKLTSVTAYRQFDAFEISDADGISLPVITIAEDARGKQASQEVRLTFEQGPLTAFVGGSYFHERGSQSLPVQFDERIALARLTGQLAGPIPGRAATDPAPAAIFANTAFTGALLQAVAAGSGVALPTAQARAIAANLKPAHLERSTNRSRTDAVDIFGDATYRVTDRFELGAGLRYTHDDKRSDYSAAVLNGRSILGGFIGALSQPAPVRTALLGALAVPGAAAIPTSAAFPVPLFGLATQPTANNGDIESATLKNGGFSFRLTARYAPSADASLYATYARGRRPEVLAATSPASPFASALFNPVQSERVDSYEIGAKTALADRTLFLDGAFFFYKYNNFQTTVQQGVQFVITNAGKAESYGFEGQARWSPNDMISLFATYAYNHSRFKTGARDGNHFRLSPDHSGSIGATGAMPLGRGRVMLTPTLTWQSKTFFDNENDRPDLQQPPASLVSDPLQDEFQNGFALVNARIGYEAPGRAWRIEAFVENMLAQKYIKDAGGTGDALGLPTAIVGDPRFYGISASVRFGGAK